jgi:hypothetical protein
MSADPITESAWRPATDRRAGRRASASYPRIVLLSRRARLPGALSELERRLVDGERRAATLSRVRVQVTDDTVAVLLARWEKILGLMGDIRVPLADIGDVRFVEKPIREAMGSGIKAGLRLPGTYYVARTIHLDRAFVVKRGLPGLAFAVRNQGPLESVLVSTADAKELARKMRKA